MKTREFFFNLPDERIAQFPSETRGGSRLVVLRRSSGSIEHASFERLPEFLKSGSVLVLNDSRVRKARVFGTAELTGGTVEFLFIEKTGLNSWKAIVSKSKKQKPGKRFLFGGGISATIDASEDDVKIVRFDRDIDEGFFETYGHVPLPPYIKRADGDSDETRYQTIFAVRTGSVAAPTAGLHFSQEMIVRLGDAGIEIAKVTLHVGIGTFLPIRAQNIEDHRMHSECYEVPEESARILNEARVHGKEIIAVGTTVVRTLESAFDGKTVRSGKGMTDLFIYPGYEFGIVRGLITNFHTPESSLLVLVSAFATRELIMRAYAEALDAGYRFFSYGDAMLIL